MDEKELENNKKSNDETMKNDDHKKQSKKEQIERLTKENYELRESYLRSNAELENYKKRMNEERIKERKYASTNLIGDLLIPLDQLNKVVELKVDDEKLKNFLIGFKMINDKIYQVLKDDGLKEIKALNEKFDPNFHYAVEKTNDLEKENGIITEVIQTGYMYKERLLRPSMVKVNEWSDNNEQDNK